MGYKFIEDPGHGWLAVSLHELVELRIVNKITGYSYVSDDRQTVYLEEDCDLGVFARAKGWTPDTAYTHWDYEYQENTFVRSLSPYRLQLTEKASMLTTLSEGSRLSMEGRVGYNDGPDY